MAVAFPIGVVAVVGHSKGVAGPTVAAPLVVAHTVAEGVAGPTAAAPLVVAHTVAEGVAGPSAAGDIVRVAIGADPLVVAHTAAEVALVAIVDYP